jgi:hypothetical protein
VLSPAMRLNTVCTSLTPMGYMCRSSIVRRKDQKSSALISVRGVTNRPTGVRPRRVAGMSAKIGADQFCLAPTVSAIVAPRAPSGFGLGTNHRDVAWTLTAEIHC